MPRQISAILLAAALAAAPLAHAEPVSGDALRQGFVSPPMAARPLVWWHWMNGNVTRDGIEKDLAWMKAVGLGGLQNFDANLSVPPIVERRLAYMTPEWKDAFRHAVKTAASHGLEFGIAASPGWSETGGPWVRPEDGMKKLVWSQTDLEGGKRVKVKLPAPPSVTGPFQTQPMPPSIEEIIGARTGPKRQKPQAYGDAVVLAFPAPTASRMASPQMRTGEGVALDVAAVTDDDLATVSVFEAPADGSPAEIRISYPAPVTVRAASFHLADAVNIFTPADYLPTLEVEDAGSWRAVAELPVRLAPTTASFAPASGRNFRVVFRPRPVTTGAAGELAGGSAPGVAIPNLFPPPSKTYKLADLRLLAEPRVHRFEAKAGFVVERDYLAVPAAATPGLEAEAGVPPGAVIDLTARMTPEGELDWTPPPGRWRVLRLGWSLEGAENHPATPEATGLEVDKYDAAAVRRYLDTYLSMYRDAVGADLMGPQGLGAILTDSIESGPSNWTPSMAAHFRRLRGYDITPWLPALTGTVVGTRAETDAFLDDYRRTLADLIASEHYGVVAETARANGLKVYGEALEDGRPVIGDDLAMRSHADVPMAAMWTFNRNAKPRATLLGDIKGASSVAHVYGRSAVAAESLTSASAPWADAPHTLKRVIDLEFALGVTRPVIHTSVHQPLDDRKPGLSLAIFGQYFNRHESWAGMARPWVDYIARTGFMLQQGRNVADVAYLHGEEAPVTAMYVDGRLTDTPRRHAFDFVNADMLRDAFRVENGELVTTGGARYRALYLGGSSHTLQLSTLRRIEALVEAGATVIGDAPVATHGLNKDGAEMARISARLWSGAEVTQVGAGRVIAGRDVEAGLARAGVAPDFTHSGDADSEILFVHRDTGDGQVWFLTNRRNRPERIEARFRVSGLSPEIWRAETGQSEPALWRRDGETTVVSLDMAPEDAFFVVFRTPTDALSGGAPAPEPVEALALTGPWAVSFSGGTVAPPAITLDALASLSDHAEPDVRHFSGVSTYTQTFRLKKRPARGAQMWLDLGAVGDLAEVRVNGKPVGTAWRPPYRLDVTGALKAGRNTVEIRVANRWVNRLIGDAQPGARVTTFTPMPTYRPDAPLQPSGLIGPVRLLEARRAK